MFILTAVDSFQLSALNTQLTELSAKHSEFMLTNTRLLQVLSLTYQKTDTSGYLMNTET